MWLEQESVQNVARMTKWCGLQSTPRLHAMIVKKNNHLKKKNVPGSKMKASDPQIVPHFEVRIF